MKGWKKIEPGVYVPNTSLSDDDFKYTEEELRLYLKHSHSPIFVEILRKYNKLV